MPELKVAFVVSRRSDGGRRDELWKFCSQWWKERFPDYEIVTGGSAGETFNRGEALNSAVRSCADNDVFVVLDGDVIADEQQVRDAVASAYRTGRACFAFDRYLGLNQTITDKILDGHDGDWTGGAALKMTNHESSIMAVPADLWKKVRGFDERFKSWGQDDRIFAHTCRVMGGGVDRVPGDVFHLHHAHSPERDKRHPGIRANDMLASRYYKFNDPASLGAELSNRDAEVAVVVVTNGRRDCIRRTLNAAHLNLAWSGPLIIADDTNDIEFRAWLRFMWPQAEIIHGSPKLPRDHGFAANTRRALEAGLATGCPWIFHLEDDFIIQRPVDLGAMMKVMDENPHLSQIVLRRQAWFPGEIAAGGLLEESPDAYTERRLGDEVWLEHRLGHWTNPNLVCREFIAAHLWPLTANSESQFSKQIIREGYCSAFWESASAEPLVEHVGERSGTNY